MQIEKLNELFSDCHINKILTDIATKNDFRMCLNRDVMDAYRFFFTDILMLSFVVDILPSELQEVYEDVEAFLARKLCLKLQVENIYENKDKVEQYFNKILGNKNFYFHGTLSTMENFFHGNACHDRVLIAETMVIDEIYRKYGIYRIFENGVRDYKNDNFFVTTHPSSVCFYALQSPEYFARFASRSDYYKQDIFKYDRIAYYRKDFKACLKNINREMKEFRFNKLDKQVVLKIFHVMWKKIVVKNMKNIVLFKEVQAENVHHFKNDEKLFEMLSSYFCKVHFLYDFNEFIKDFKKIVLPDVKVFLRCQTPVFNRKFVIFEGEKVVSDFYVDCKYIKHDYFSLGSKKGPLIWIDKKIENNDFFTLIRLVNEARANTVGAKRFFKNELLPKVSDVIAYYRQKFEELLERLKNEKIFTEKLAILKDICEDVGLKYVVSLKYNQFFKDVSLYYIYQFRKFLGAKLFEHYDGIPVVSAEKVDKVTDLFEQILKTDFVLNVDIPKMIEERKLEVIK